MKTALLGFALALVCVAAPAGAQNYNPAYLDHIAKLGPGTENQCALLRRQIAKITKSHHVATRLENEDLTERFEGQILWLRAIQEIRCPQDVPVDNTGEAFKQLLELAARGALTYFTFGAYGFMTP